VAALPARIARGAWSADWLDRRVCSSVLARVDTVTGDRISALKAELKPSACRQCVNSAQLALNVTRHQ
jgi:hypothetical protein